jgi:hypothetical protein
MVYECPVPRDQCHGALKQVEPGFRMVKIHGSTVQVKKCIRKYLTDQGYRPGRNGEFYKEGEPVLMVSKKPGGRLRYGKEKTRYIHVKQRSAFKSF